MRTSVGWFSSPACAVIYQCAKYVALFSSKGYAIGAKFRNWLEAEQHERRKEASQTGQQLLGFVEDMLAICGSRDYVFFMDAAVADRFSQEGSLKTFLDEEKDLGGEAASQHHPHRLPVRRDHGGCARACTHMRRVPMAATALHHIVVS